MSVYIKDMDMPVDCLACRIGCIYATSLVIGRPEDCPLEGAKTGDLIRREDAIEAVVCHIWHMPNEVYRQFNCENIVREVVEDAIKRLPSAEAEPTVIRSRTLMPTKDFKEWAKRIREENPNAIVILCDAEVVSADAVSREEYEETDGVIKIKKQSAKDVGEIKHIVVCSPNYTRYFYNESMPLPSADAEQVTSKLKKPCDSLLKSDSDECKDQKSKLADAVHKPDYSYEADMVRRLREYEQGYRQAQAEAVTHGRLIDADALSEKLCETTIFIKDGEVFQRMINDAPTVSAEAVQGWIPCSERLPEVGEICLLTVHEYGWNCKDYTRVIIGEYSDNYADHILAWMPLPEPYEPKTERRG